MGEKKQNDINDMLGKLRASVDKPAKSAKKTAGNDVFDREIAALIQKQLNSNTSSAQTAEDVTDAEPSSFYSDEIKLEDFVIDDETEKESIELEETIEDAPLEFEETVENEPVLETLELEETVEDEPVLETLELEETVEDEPALETLELEETVEDEPELEPLELEETVEDEPELETLELEETVEDEPALETLELEETVEDEPALETLELEDIIEDTSSDLEEPMEYDEQSEEMPPAVMQALEDAFAVDENDLSDGLEPNIRDIVLSGAEIVTEDEEIVDDEIIAADEVIVENDAIIEDETVAENEAIVEDEIIAEDEVIAEDESDIEAEVIVEAQTSEQVDAEIDEPSVLEQESVEQPISSDEHASRLSDDDIKMMLALGKESDLGERMGYEDLDEYKKNLRQEQTHEPENMLDLPDAYAYRGVEYKSHAQDEQIMDDYNKCRAVAIIKLIVGVIICGICGFMENARYFGFWLLEPFEPVENPGVFVLTLTGLLLGGALLCLRQLKNGIVSVVKMSPDPHAMTFFAIAAALICNIVMAIVRPDTVTVYNFPATLYIVVTLVSELITICREINSFSVASSDGVRYSPEREAQLFEQKYNSRVSAKVGGQSRRVYNIVASRFSDGYFRRTNEKKKGIYILNFMLLPTVAVAFVELIIALSLRQTFTEAVGVFTATFVVIMPLPLMVALVAPPLASSIRLKKQRSAILGDSAVDEFSRSKLLVFEDRDMFPADKIETKGLKLYDGFELYDVLIKTGSLFAHIGGPLGELFEAENAKYHRIRDVKLVKVDRGGVEAVLEGDVNILAGKIDFIEKYGIYPKRAPRDEQLIAEGAVSVIYIVIDSRPAARLYSDYRTDSDFERSICELCRFGDAAAIRTSDPGIDEAMINRKRTETEYELSVIRPGSAHDGQERDTFDGGIISLDTARGLIKATAECHKIKKSRKISMILYFFAYLVGVIGITLLVTLKMSSYIASGLVVVYLLLWMLPVLFLPAIFDTSKKK